MRWSEGDEPDPSAPPSDRQLADRLVEMGLLNAWQAKQLLDGRTKFNLGPYSIIDSIGQGGMGQVFKARHGKIGRIVAVKVLAPRQVHARGHRQFHPRNPRLGQPRPSEAGRRASTPARTATSITWSRNTCPAWICGSWSGSEGPLEHGGRRFDHLARWPKDWNTPTPRGSSTAT